MTVPEGTGPKVIVTSVQVFVGGNVGPLNMANAFHDGSKQNRCGQTVMVPL